MISSVRSSPPHRPVIKKKKRNYENRVQIERVSDFVNIVNEGRNEFSIKRFKYFNYY